MACNSDKCVSDPIKQVSSDDHPTPFNLGPMCVLMIFCVIMSLSSSLYHNWPAIERIFIDDRVFESLCTEQQRRKAIPGFFVCDKQRDAIGDLTLYVFFSEFVAFSLCGPLADVIGVYVILIIGFTSGFFAFLSLYYFHFSLAMIKMACCFWGFSGGSVIIVSVHFARMFPETTSLADGMMIFFENISSVIPIVIGKIMKHFKLRYYEAFGSYVIWGIIPSFLLSITFIPSKILTKNEDANGKGRKELNQELKNEKFWMNLVVYSIPVTASVFYRKTFSAYFLNNQRLIQVFPIIQLFVFVPTPFVAVLDQFLGIHLTSSLLYLCYIVGFCCFLYPTRGNGLMSIICFVIAHAAEHQIMHYISQYHPNYESTLMGISYAVVCIVGSMLERIFTMIYNKVSPRIVIYIISALLILSIVYSIYCHLDPSCAETDHGTTRFRIIYVIFWLIPFLLLCLVLSIRGIYGTKIEKKKQPTDETLSVYLSQKILTISIMFYSFSFYYVCNVFLILVSILEISNEIRDERLRVVALFSFLVCFFVLPQLLLILQFRYVKSYVNISFFIFLLFLFKVVLYIANYMIHGRYFVHWFSFYLFVYGYLFFMFTHMLTFYNFQITYAERLYKSSLLHIGSVFTVFMLFRFFYHELARFTFKYYVLWVFSLCFYIFFSTILYMYFSYEMDIPYTSVSANLCFPKGWDRDLSSYFDSSCFEIIANTALMIANFGFLLNLVITRVIHWLFLGLLVIDTVSALSVLFPDYVEFLNSPPLSCGLTIVSCVLFLGMAFTRVVFSCNNFYKNVAISILAMGNFVVLAVANNICWLKTQSELQKKDQCNCCCKDLNKECCKTGCCFTKKGNNKCTCFSSDCKHCKLLSKSIFNPSNCLSCMINKCSKTISVTEDDHIVFCFYETEQEQVNKKFINFFTGSLIGWAVFVIYIGIVKERSMFHTFL